MNNLQHNDCPQVKREKFSLICYSFSKIICFLSILLALTFGVILGALFSGIVLSVLPSFIVLAVILFILIIALAIIKKCQRCPKDKCS